MNFRTTNIPCYNPIQEAHEAVEDHIRAVTDTVAIEIKDEFPDKDEARIAEIALAVCSKLLRAHFSMRAAKGWKPLDR